MRTRPEVAKVIPDLQAPPPSRESLYRLLPQTTPENINKNFEQYTLDPGTRYPNLNSHCVRPHQASASLGPCLSHCALNSGKRRWGGVTLNFGPFLGLRPPRPAGLMVGPVLLPTRVSILSSPQDRTRTHIGGDIYICICACIYIYCHCAYALLILPVSNNLLGQTCSLYTTHGPRVTFFFH